MTSRGPAPMRRPTAPRPPPPIVPSDAAGHQPGHLALAKAHRPGIGAPGRCRKHLGAGIRGEPPPRLAVCPSGGVSLDRRPVSVATEDSLPRPRHRHRAHRGHRNRHAAIVAAAVTLLVIPAAAWWVIGWLDAPSPVAATSVSTA